MLIVIHVLYVKMVMDKAYNTFAVLVLIAIKISFRPIARLQWASAKR